MNLGTKRYSRLVILSSRTIFSNSVPKISYLSQAKFQSALFRMPLSTKGYSGCAYSEFNNCFLKFRPKNTFFWPGVSKCFAQNVTRYEGEFRGTNSEYDNFLFNSCPQNEIFFSNLALKFQSTLFEMKLDTKGYLVVLIPRSVIVF